jgi:hypothetical protein
MRAATAGRPAAAEPGPDGGSGQASESNGAGDAGAPLEHYDDLEPDEIVGLVDSLEEDDLGALLEYERGHLARAPVVSAIEGVLTRRRSSQRG